MGEECTLVGICCMTENDAIEEIRKAIEEIESSDHLYYSADERRLYSFMVAKQTLERQISKKPFRDMYKLSVSCPTCGADLFDDMYNHHCTCGQALDWSDD